MVFHEVKVKLSESQGKKLAHAHKLGTSCTLRLNKDNIYPNAIPLLLTESEFKKINSGKTHDINLSATRVKQGGFLPALIAAIPTIAAVLGGLSGITGIASNIKTMATGKSLTGCQCRCNGFISDLNIPLISPLAKIFGMGIKHKRNRGRGLFLKPN